MEAVFDTPVAANGSGNLFGTIFEAGDIVGNFMTGLIFKLALPLNPDDGFKIGPIFSAL